ncbi:type II toxin-antitoxin system ParD family antitoxin [Novosphingobium sp.]|uniref:ribbon-helix-helix domain-containing protein n=1 Tax=Novosphingobium sp. TaxID=1874826 RepID=UPI00261236EA|nr:type II toxin-antitoxin system ParD family antitoxin [Novosphingobium sp.]
MLKVSFAQVDEAYLRSKVENGFYSSVSEAIRDMVRKQREREQSSLLAALEAGEQAIRDGQVFDYDTAAFEGAVSRGVKAARVPDAGPK